MQGPGEMMGFLVRLAGALVRKPGLITTAFRQAAILAPRRWWAQGSHLPLPPQDYLDFRSVTLSGEPGATPSVHDVIVYLQWCKSMRALPQRA